MRCEINFGILVDVPIFFLLLVLCLSFAKYSFVFVYFFSTGVVLGFCEILLYLYIYFFVLNKVCYKYKIVLILRVEENISQP